VELKKRTGFALAIEGKNNFYAGGWFDTAGGIGANYIF